MSEIINYIYTTCPNCKKRPIADLRDCGCVFGKCEYCGTDFEICDNCGNLKER